MIIFNTRNSNPHINGGSVNQLVIEHLSVQGRPDPKGKLHYFWCPNKTRTPPISASIAPKMK